MKKFYLSLVIIISLIIFIPTNNKTTYADIQTEYRRVLDDTTPFYKNVYDKEPLFFLPFSYYVKIIGHSGEYYHVEIHGDNGQVAIDGYVPSKMLFEDNLPVISPYLKLTITTAYTAVLFADQGLLNPIQYIFSERTLYYYGEIISEQGKLFYVGYNNKLGYVKESDVYPFIIQNHPNDLPFSSPDSATQDLTATADNDFFGLKSIIIACLIFAGAIALFITLKNSHDKQKNLNYYEENDYE